MGAAAPLHLWLSVRSCIKNGKLFYEIIRLAKVAQGIYVMLVMSRDNSGR